MTGARSEASTRERIVEAADALFYERGFEPTSFADIAQAVELSRGNFYHHFKAKDDLLAAVISRRARQTQAMLDAWTHDAATPEARLLCFARMLIHNRSAIERHGCPVGTLCAELSKREHPARADASAIFGQFRRWLCAQFEALGHGDGADALALHLLMRSQGIASLATAFRDKHFVEREVAAIRSWLDALPRHPPGADARHF